MGRRIAYAGVKRRIEFALDSRGESSAERFFDQLEPRWQARLMYLFEGLGEHGGIQNRELFKKIEGAEYWEFKCFQVRLICRFLPGGVVQLLHGFKKKKDRIPPGRD
jgi:hypothetical protein